MATGSPRTPIESVNSSANQVVSAANKSEWAAIVEIANRLGGKPAFVAHL